MRPWSSFELASTAGIAVLAVAVRLPGVWTQPLWQDEVASARVITEPTVGAMLRQVLRTESTPPFWYFVVWLLHRAGMPAQDGRFLSIALGGVLAVLTVVLARRVVAVPFALAAGGLVALGGELVARGRDLRAYELLAVLSLLFALCLLDELERPSRRRGIALAGVVATGGLTHFFFAFTVIAGSAWLLLEPRARDVRVPALRAVAAGGVVAGAWLPLMLMQYHPGRFWWIGAFRLRPVVAVPLRLFTVAYSRPVVGPALSTVTFLLVLAGGLRLARRSPAGLLVLVLALGPVAEAAAVWLLGMPIFDLRNLVGVGPFVAIAVAGSVEVLPRRAAAPVAAGLVVAAGVSLANVGLGFRTPFDRIAATLVRNGWDGSQPIAVYGNPYRFRLPLAWYLPGRPTLEIARPATRSCRELFVVRASGRVTRRVGDLPATKDDALRGAALLVESGRDLPCAADAGRR